MKRASFLLLVFLAAPAWADSGMLLVGMANRQMALDGLAAPTACYSVRRLLTSYTANKAFRVVRASDSATSDIGFRADGNPDTATLTTFLNATTGKFDIFYDQCGSRNLVQATDGNRPAVTISCQGGWPCAVFTAATQTLAGSNITPATGNVSFSVIAKRTNTTVTCTLMAENGSQNWFITSSGGANTWRVLGSSGTVNTTSAADNAFHAGQATINGASSTIQVDATATVTGTATGGTTAGAPNMTGGAAITCSMMEGVIWDNVVNSADTRSYLIRSQRIFGGF